MTLLKVTWKGEFDKTDRANPRFQAGLSYMATIQIHFEYEKSYVANHQIVNNYHMDSSLFKVTVNGVAAETENGSPGNPTVKVNLALDNNLLDTALLGSDYTKPISRSSAPWPCASRRS